MIKKEWRKLEKQLIEENEKNNNEEEPKEDNNDKKEIIIVDINNNIEEEKDKEDKNENNNNKSKYGTKPGPILKVDTTSLNMTEYQVNNDQKDYGYPQYNNYYKGYNSSLNYIPRNYNNKYARNSHFNTQNNIYNNNNHINNLAKSNDYTYTISTRYNSLLNKDNNNNYKNIDTPYRLNRNNSYLGNNYNSTGSNIIYLKNKPLLYNYNLPEKPDNLRSVSYRRYTDIDKKDDNSKRNENNNYLSNSQRINSSLYNTSKNSLYPKEKRITYCLSNSNSIDDIIMRYNNRIRNYKGLSPYRLNYNYI